MGLINLFPIYTILKNPKTLAIDSIDVEQKNNERKLWLTRPNLAAYGGFNYIKFNKTGSFSVNKIKILT